MGQRPEFAHCLVLTMVSRIRIEPCLECRAVRTGTGFLVEADAPFHRLFGQTVILCAGRTQGRNGHDGEYK
jgi:hypothetical protein